MVTRIREKFTSGNFEYSLHAADQSILRKISVTEVMEAMSAAELIEDYPSDKYGPSCLLFGLTHEGRPIHVQCTAALEAERVKIITVYESDPEHWLEWKTR